MPIDAHSEKGKFYKKMFVKFNNRYIKKSPWFSHNPNLSKLISENLENLEDPSPLDFQLLPLCPICSRLIANIDRILRTIFFFTARVTIYLSGSQPFLGCDTF